MDRLMAWDSAIPELENKVPHWSEEENGPYGLGQRVGTRKQELFDWLF